VGCADIALLPTIDIEAEHVKYFHGIFLARREDAKFGPDFSLRVSASARDIPELVDDEGINALQLPLSLLQLTSGSSCWKNLDLEKKEDLTWQF
jgi:hypothetical protein